MQATNLPSSPRRSKFISDAPSYRFFLKLTLNKKVLVYVSRGHKEGRNNESNISAAALQV